MRPMILLMVALVGCPHGPPPAAPAAPAPPAAPPVLAPALAEWPGGVPPGPPRRGSGGATDLRALARSQDIFTVEAALPTLAGLDGPGHAALRAALAEDPRWRLGAWQGHAVAWRRCQASGGWGAG